MLISSFCYPLISLYITAMLSLVNKYIGMQLPLIMTAAQHNRTGVHGAYHVE